MLPYIIPHLQHIAASNFCDCHGSRHADFVSGRIEQARFSPENTKLSMHALQRTSPTPYNNDHEHLTRCNPENVAVFITTKDQNVNIEFVENETNVLQISHKVIGWDRMGFPITTAMSPSMFVTCLLIDHYLICLWTQAEAHMLGKYNNTVIP